MSTELIEVVKKSLANMIKTVEHLQNLIKNRLEAASASPAGDPANVRNYGACESAISSLRSISALCDNNLQNIPQPVSQNSSNAPVLRPR